MNYEMIGSSSKGNCIIVEEFLMLDCGVAYSKIKKYLPKVKMIYVSHIHKDHLLPSTIKKIAYNYPNIRYITSSTEVVEKLVELTSKKNIWYLKPATWYNLGMVKVATEMLYHDKFNYSLKWEYHNKLGFYAVDTSRIDHIEAKNYDMYFIEANYQDEVLEENIANCEDEGMLFYFKRVPKTHLSYQQANDFLIENMGDNSNFLYIHQSSHNFKEEQK